MSDDTTGRDGERDIERVLRAAGARAQPPAELEAAVRAAARAEWRTVVAERRAGRTRRVRLALAASVLLAIGGAWLGRPLVNLPGEPVAEVALATGEVLARGGLLRRWRSLSGAQAVRAGEEIRTGTDGRTALDLDGISVRLDRLTNVAFDAAHRLVIRQGAVYVDAGAPSARGDGRLEVLTPAGSVRHVGTQYEVRVRGESVRVRVREGLVQLDLPQGRSARGGAGEELTVAAGGTHLQRGSVARFGDDWSWVLETAPAVSIDGLPLPEFLRWVGRELGRDIGFATPQGEAEAQGVVLSGSVAGLTPEEALGAVLATTALRSTERDGRILIERIPGR